MSDTDLLTAIKTDLEIIKGKLLQEETASIRINMRLSLIEGRLGDIDARLTNHGSALETIHLLCNPTNAKELRSSIAEAQDQAFIDEISK